jgi:hypothetical protein
MPSPARASRSPSVKKQASDPGGSGRTVSRSPVGTSTPSGGDPHAVTGSTAPGPATIGAGCPAVA